MTNIDFANLPKEELIHLLDEYDRYIQNANDENHYREGWHPVCLHEFYNNEFQEAKGDTKYNEDRLVVDTPVGTLLALSNTDPDYPGMCIMLDHPDAGWIDLLMAEYDVEKEVIALRAWTDVCNEDYTHRFDVLKQEIESLSDLIKKQMT